MSSKQGTQVVGMRPPAIAARRRINNDPMTAGRNEAAA
jgi:hypothetical protein